MATPNNKVYVVSYVCVTEGNHSHKETCISSGVHTHKIFIFYNNIYLL